MQGTAFKRRSMMKWEEWGFNQAPTSRRCIGRARKKSTGSKM